MWIIDFGVDMSEAEAALYEAPFEYVREHVRPVRAQGSDRPTCRTWWLHVEPARACGPRSPACTRYIATPRHVEAPPLRLAATGDARLTARSSSSPATTTTRSASCTRASHELWARATGHAASRGRVRLPLHAHHLLRDLPVPGPDPRAARQGRGGRPPPRRAPRRLAQPARPRPRRPREAHPHQPLQPAPHLARQRPRRPRRRRLRRLRLARRPRGRRHPRAPPRPQPRTRRCQQ